MINISGSSVRPKVYFVSARYGGRLVADKGHAGVHVKLDAHDDVRESIFELEIATKKKVVGKADSDGLALKTSHNHYLKADGRHVKIGGNKPKKSERWHIYEVEACADKRMQDFKDAQILHTLKLKNIKSPKDLPIFELSHSIAFTLKEKIFSAGAANITGPDDRVWYKVGPVSGVFFSGLRHYGISNTHGEPLIVMVELRDTLRVHKYQVYRCIKPSGQESQQDLNAFKYLFQDWFGYNRMTVTAHLVTVPLATIERTEVVIGAAYDISLSSGVMMNLTGGFGDFKTTFKETRNGVERVTCTVLRHPSVTAGHYTIRIEPDSDILLYLVFAVAIDKMHHERAAERGDGLVSGGVRGVVGLTKAAAGPAECKACFGAPCKCKPYPIAI